MLTFRPAASVPLVAFLALSYLFAYIPGSNAQNQLPVCAQPCAAAGIATSECSADDTTCICASDPFLISFTTCINQGCSSDDIQATLTYYSIACAGGPGFGAPSSSTGSSTASSSVVTFPSSVSPTGTTSSPTPATTSRATLTTGTTTTTGTNTRSTPSSTLSSSSAVSSTTNAAAGLSSHAHAAAALMAGGIGAFVAVAV